ncbi:N-acetylglucosamine-6-phosphate deacetylase [Thermasporomyces composti]|uniref:N-acetylglucosamine-6-phosphate deacetylase n=1 Tax=Thermasporomyces composti TaxID=696763 RepID=A0A3D9V304_THECX|nr:N-acetylglucosamine-6-phosphate deacetylase [Thermasporomyces composti]REF35879.1 N-acetylglucosamine-6-phosphate deacetylase [Thermasporomyces composti]
MTLLGNGRVVTPEAVLDPGWIEISGERIVEVGSGEAARPLDVDLAGRVVVPGFVDTHVHGGGGASYLSATQAETATVVQFHRSHGTTTTFASLISTTAPELERQVAALAELAADGLVDGLHLEGPWISEARRGAHDPAVLRPPTTEELERLLALGRGTIRMVTLAPELPGALDAVRRIVDAGVVAAVGHSDASYETVRAAVDAGASVGTHLFNGMPPLHHREPGVVGALLEDPRVVVELVADGIHLHPATVALAIRAAGPDRVSLVTDAMTAAGMGDGDYTLGGLPVRVVDGVARLADSDSIAGSTLTMDAAFRFAVQTVGLSLEQAARVASTTPARTFGLSDVGALQPGMRADLVVLDADLQVTAVMRRGSWVSGDPTRTKEGS